MVAPLWPIREGIGPYAPLSGWVARFFFFLFSFSFFLFPFFFF
jgi:hypothetical protein